MLAEMLCHDGDDIRAITLLDAAIPNMRGEGPLFIATMFIIRARLARACGDDANAAVWLHKSLELASKQGATVQLAHTNYELRLLTLMRSNVAHAHHHFHQSLTLFRAAQGPWHNAVALLGTGLTELLLDNRAVAMHHYTESLYKFLAIHQAIMPQRVVQ